jgi:hypothetical protein
MSPPPPTCMGRRLEEIELVRRMLARNVRALAATRSCTLRVPVIARLTGWHVSRVYALLAGRVNVGIDQVANLATSLGGSPAALLRRREAAC